MSHDKEKTRNHCTEGCQRVYTAILKQASNNVSDFCSQIPWRYWSLGDLASQRCLSDTPKKFESHFMNKCCSLCYCCTRSRKFWDMNCKTKTNDFLAVLVAKFQGSLPLYYPWLSQSFHILSFSVSRSFGNSNWNLAFVTSNFGLGVRQFDGTTTAKFQIPSKHDMLSKFRWLIPK